MNGTNLSQQEEVGPIFHSAEYTLSLKYSNSTDNQNIVQSKQTGMYMWLRGVYRKDHWYRKVYLKMKKKAEQKEESTLENKVEGSFITMGKTVGVTEKGRKKDNTNRGENAERGQTPD